MNVSKQFFNSESDFVSCWCDIINKLHRVESNSSAFMLPGANTLNPRQENSTITPLFLNLPSTIKINRIINTTTKTFSNL
jgi:hypothetical protein